MNSSQFPTIYCSQETLNNLNIGDALYGIHHKEDNTFNLISPSLGGQKIGQVVSLEDYQNNNSSNDNLIAVKHPLFNKGIEFKFKGNTCRLKLYDLENQWFSRNTGILETQAMLNKTAIIIGAGSVGSVVAVQLAKSGVGNFVLIDNDTVEPHNIARSQYSIKDIGQAKVKALSSLIKQSNPVANVVPRRCIIEQVEPSIFDKFCHPNHSIIISVADSRQADRWASEIAGIYQVPFISIGLWKRASVGEIFYYLPGKHPCYECAFKNALEDDTEVQQDKRFYISQQDKTETTFEPGLSIDINFVTLIALKLMVDLLNRHTVDYVPKVIHYLTQFTLVCNTNESRIGGENATIFTHPLQITNNISVDYLGFAEKVSQKFRRTKTDNFRPLK